MNALLNGFEIGHRTSFTRTVTEADVADFARITSDYSPNHVDGHATASLYGERIAHGVLTLGLASAAATQFLTETGLSAVSYGYDKVRFIRPVFFGDTITVTYEITAIDHERNETRAEVTAANQNNEVVMAAQHILRMSDS